MDKKKMLEDIISHYANGNKALFARNLGITAQAISTWLSRNTFDVDLIYAKCEYINPDWLLTGRGDMLKSDNQNIITKIHNPTKYTEKIHESQDVTLHDIKAAANLKTLFTDKNQHIIGKITLPDTPKCDGAMYVTGNSMDPLIKSGDIIFYKEIHDLSMIVYGNMYLVSMDIEGDEYLTIKYINRSENGKDWICLRSHNQLHSPQDFALSHINALALIKASIRMNTM
jgi:phage repressor protein C with HTH and peptisase S24 domain